MVNSIDIVLFKIYQNLLPTRCEEREVLGVGTIPVAILPSYQDVKTIALYFHKHEYSRIVKKRNTSETVLRPHYTIILRHMYASY